MAKIIENPSSARVTLIKVSELRDLINSNAHKTLGKVIKNIALGCVKKFEIAYN